MNSLNEIGQAKDDKKMQNGQKFDTSTLSRMRLTLLAIRYEYNDLNFLMRVDLTCILIDRIRYRVYD